MSEENHKQLLPLCLGGVFDEKIGKVIYILSKKPMGISKSYESFMEVMQEHCRLHENLVSFRMQDV